jgi:hypothetical protein
LPAGVVLHLPSSGGSTSTARQIDNPGSPTAAAPASLPLALTASLDLLAAHGVHDVCLVRSGGWLSGSGVSDQALIDALESRGLHYGIALDARPERALVGFQATPSRIDVPAEWRVPGRRLNWTIPLPGARAAVYALVDLESDSVVAAGRVPVTDGQARIEIGTRPARRLFPPGAARLLVVPERELSGLPEERPFDFWSAWQDTQDTLARQLSAVKWGPGLRFFARPSAPVAGLSGESEELVPSSGAFRLQFESWLERRYPIADLNTRWALNDHQVTSMTVAARLVPMWGRAEQGDKSGWLLDPVSYEPFRVDLRRCGFWRDLSLFRAESIRRANSAAGTLIKKLVADVPVVWQWTEYHPTYTIPDESGGLDGLAFISPGRGREAAVSAAAYAYAQAEASLRPTWFLQLGQHLDSAGPPASAEELRLDWNWLREIGCKGFFYDGVGAAAGSQDEPRAALAFDLAAVPDRLDWIRDFGDRIKTNQQAADYRPVVLYYPSSVMGTSLTGRLDNGVWWLPSFASGQWLSLGGDVEGYWIDRSPDPAPPGTGRGVLVLWSTNGAQKATFMIPADSPVTIYDSTGRTLKQVTRRGRLQLPLDTTPVMVTGLSVKNLFPLETAAQALEEFEALVKEAEAQKMDVAAFRLALNQAKTVFTPSAAGTAYQMIRAPLAMLRAALTPYIWVEGESAAGHNWSGVQPDPRACGGSFLLLDRAIAPTTGAYQARYAINLERAATYELWLAGSVPGSEDSSPFTWRMDDQTPSLALPSDSTRRFAPGLGWTRLGQVQLTPGRHTLVIAATEPARSGNYHLVVDALVLASEPFLPDGTRHPGSRQNHSSGQ